MTTKFVVFALFAVAAMCAGGAYLLYPSAEQDDVVVSSGGNPVVGSLLDDSSTFDTIVRFDGERFEPRDLTIQKGTRVRFLNESDEGVWPASAVHPTHSVYPDKDPSNCLGSSFDSCRVLTKGEFFDFTFEHEGEWRYHDHVRAFKTGVVIVTP